ncbi:hypothetical protein BO71DRAFT_421779 [Aspergillus ellipticus CBS 707.79]|uniref:Protein kinase domain-containing protein n=1 Tax=Aspergillus ellipticus CBS 707.79 TaxID=1448320 RepID=A0A319DSX0_9EURO|nr:hypothetical protein BO71DRAFT_421779 [Aspergillus ellipticus CBS 707.79]
MPCPDPSFYGQSRRIRWYQDIIRAILHLHGLGLTHSDLHRGNVFLNHNGQAVLGDFGGCCRYGVENPFVAAPENGYAKTVTDASDRFAMGSLIYEMETGARPKITADENGNLVFPCIYTGHGGIDLLIDNAWLGRYASTADMLAHAEELMTDAAPSIHGMVQQAVSKKELRAQVKKWREGREKEHGKYPELIGWVLYGLPTEHEMRQMADKVGWKMEEERKFGKLSRT